MTALLSVRGLKVRVGDVEAVRGIDLEVQRGETLALVGESGSGKSMTALSIMGLTPPGSRVSFDEMCFETGAHPATLRGDRVTIVFQEPMTALNPVFTIGDQLSAVYRHHRGGTRHQARARALELLNRVRVRDAEAKLAHYPHMLSGGQRQRVLIAMALMCGPDLLIADEPTTALDVTTQARLLELLTGLQEELGLGMLFITHDLGVVARVAHRVAVMQSGTIVETGDVASLLTAPRHRYTRELLESIPQPVPPREATQGPPVLEAAGIGQVYGTRGLFQSEPFRALEDINLRLGAGEILGIVGESGSGKSTLARILIGLARPTEGSMRVCGDAAERLGQRELARRVQPVFQDPYGSLNPRWTIHQILDLPLRLHTPLRRKARRARVAELVESVGLPARVLEATPRALSGGQRQRVAIARALAAEPEVLVCDEPTSALDVSVQAQILALLRRLREDRGLSIIFISHDLGVVENICDRVAVMHQGRIVEEGRTYQLFGAPQHAHTKALKEATLKVIPRRAKHSGAILNKAG